MQNEIKITGAQCNNIIRTKRAPNLANAKIVETPSRGVVHIPRNLDLDDLLDKNPIQLNTHSNNFEKARDILATILSQISYKALYYKDYKDDSGFKNLHSRVLEGFSRDYNVYLDWAKNTGIIECDNLSIPGIKSFGYRFTDKYNHGVFKPYYIYGFKTLQRTITNSGIDKATKKKFPDLFYYLDNVELDYDKAIKVIRQVTSKQQKERNWDTEKTERKLYSRIANIDRLHRKEYIFKQDSKVGRLHTNLTSIKKEVRSYLTWKGQKLVNLDIKNSQPFFSLGIFEKNTWDRLNIGDIIRSHSHIYGSSKLDDETLYYMFAENREKVRTYSVLVLQGLLYDTLVGLEFGKKGLIIDRDMAKKVMFEVFFTPQSYETSKQKLFKSIFPDVYDVFSKINRGYWKIKGAKSEKMKRKPTDQSSTLALLLQQVEATVMLDYIVPVLRERFEGLPIFTIHDSILTLESHQNEVKQVIEEVIEEVIGFRPMIEVE